MIFSLYDRAQSALFILNWRCRVVCSKWGECVKPVLIFLIRAVPLALLKRNPFVFARFVINCDECDSLQAPMLTSAHSEFAKRATKIAIPTLSLFALLLYAHIASIFNYAQMRCAMRPNLPKIHINAKSSTNWTRQNVVTATLCNSSEFNCNFHRCRSGTFCPITLSLNEWVCKLFSLFQFFLDIP